MASTRFAPVSFLLGLLCVQAAAQANFDFYVLSFLWPGSVCREPGGCCKTRFALDPVADFFVRALYPSDAKGFIFGCPGESFSPQLLRPILGDLWNYWQVIKCPSNEDNVPNFWRAVWTNYGTCTGMDEVTYFNTTVTQRKKFDLLKQLIPRQIKPNDTFYSTQVVVDALRSAYGVKTLLLCSTDVSGKVQLQEIYLCLNKNYAQIDCPASWTQGCPERFIFHSFNVSMLGSASPLEGLLGHDSA